MKSGRAIRIFINSENLMCRSTDILKCFRGSLQRRDNENRLYIRSVLCLKLWVYVVYGIACVI